MEGREGGGEGEENGDYPSSINYCRGAGVLEWHIDLSEVCFWNRLDKGGNQYGALSQHRSTEHYIARRITALTRPWNEFKQLSSVDITVDVRLCLQLF